MLTKGGRGAYEEQRERVSGRVSNRYRPVWAPENIDLETPSTARMYDYYLGGCLRKT
jgi:hypothetical protein